MTHARFRTISFAAALLAAVLLSVVGPAAQAQPPWKALTPPQYEEFLTARFLATTMDSVRVRKSISAEELTVLGTILNKTSLPASLRADALKPLLLVRSDNLTVDSKEKLASVLGDVLRTDDTSTDSNGTIKTYALSASTLLPRSALSSEVKMLRDDKRETVRGTARRISN